MLASAKSLSMSFACYKNYHTKKIPALSLSGTTIAFFGTCDCTIATNWSFDTTALWGGPFPGDVAREPVIARTCRASFFVRVSHVAWSRCVGMSVCDRGM